MGVVLLANQALKPEHVLMHNARNTFFSLGLPQLKLICQDQKIQSRCITLPPALTGLIRAIWKQNIGKPITDFELRVILALRCVEESSEIPSFCDEDILLECIDQEDLKALLAISRVHLL